MDQAGFCWTMSANLHSSLLFLFPLNELFMKEDEWEELELKYVNMFNFVLMTAL